MQCQGRKHQVAEQLDVRSVSRGTLGRCYDYVPQSHDHAGRPAQLRSACHGGTRIADQ